MILTCLDLLLRRVSSSRGSGTLRGSIRPASSARLFAAAVALASFLFSAPAAHSQTGEWVWASGSDVATPQPSVYGKKGVPASGNVPGTRGSSGSATDGSGHFWLFGGETTGFVGSLSEVYLNDLWEFNPATKQWTWQGGTDLSQGVYGVIGIEAPGNYPGGRADPVIWTDHSGNIWLFGGVGYDSAGTSGDLNDLWRFDVTNGQWAWIGGSSTIPSSPNTSGYLCRNGTGQKGVAALSNIPGSRTLSIGWTGSDGNLWLFSGSGCDLNGSLGSLNDLWKYDIGSGKWTWVSGTGTVNSAGVYTGLPGTSSSSNTPGGRYSPANLGTDSSGNLWLFGGNGYDSVGNQGFENDLWEFTPATGEWTWHSGSKLVPPPSGVNQSGQPGVYGTLGEYSPGNVPGGRADGAGFIDGKGTLWLFGGGGTSVSAHAEGFNDLWAFDPQLKQWAWMSGSDTLVCAFSLNGSCYYGAAAMYGTPGVPAGSNVPGSRGAAANWIDSRGNLWIFGGDGVDSVGTLGDLNDLWEFHPAAATTLPLAAPVFSPPAGSYSAAQTVSITDATPGATIYYTTDGTTPTTSSAVYSGPITVSSSETLEAIAAGSGTGGQTVFSENFDELTARSSATSVGQFTAINGTNVDIVGPGFYPELCVAPESDDCVDMAGTDGNATGQLQSVPITLSAGAYTLSFDLIGSQRGVTTTTSVSLGPATGTPLYSQMFTLATGDVTSGIVTNSLFTVDADETVTMNVDLISTPSAYLGSLLDNISITSVAYAPSAVATAAYVIQQPPAIVFTVPNHTYGDPPFAVSASSNSTGAFTYSVVSGPATVSGNIVTLTGAGTVMLQAAEASDSSHASGSQSATFTVFPAATGCTVPASTSNTMNIAYYTLAETDRDAGTFPNGVSSNYVLSALGINGLPVYNPDATVISGTGAIAAPKDLLADGEITWWSPTLNNGNSTGTSDVTQTGTGVVSLPYNNNNFYPPNGSGLSDANGFQTAVLTGNLVTPTTDTVSFTIGSDDMAFLYLDGKIACDDGGVHGPTSVPCTTSTIPAGAHTLELFYADLNQSGAALDFSVTTSGVGVGAGNQLVFGTMMFSPAAAEPQGTSQAITITDTVTYSGTVPTGPVSFVLNGTPYTATCTATGANQETCSAVVPAGIIAALPAGSYPVTGSFAGDCNYAVTPAPAGTFTITQQQVTFGTMTFSPVNTVLQGTSQAITISDTLSYPGAQPTGAVAYVLNNVPYTAACAGSPSSGSGSETCVAVVPAATIAALPASFYPVTANFAGDATYAPATATGATFTVTLPPPDFSIATGTLTLVTQHHGKTTVSVTPINDFAGTVNLSCGTVPAYVTCEWGPAAVAVSGGSATTELTIDTDAVLDYLSSTHAPAPRQGPNGGRFLVAGLAFPALLLLGRRRKAVVRLILCALVLVSMLKLTGCSGHYPDSTPPATYSITITGTSGTIQHTAVLKLVVTK